MDFSFAEGWFSLPRGFTGLFSQGVDGESPVVCDAHLFILQFLISSFGTGWWGEMVPFPSMRCSFGRLSVG
jgi:hypothetical protein